jgi:hypothetical protein
MKVFPFRGRKLFLALALFTLVCIWGNSAVRGIKDRQVVAQMTGKMKTVCVGRFLIDLPDEATFSRGQMFVQGFNLAGFPETQAEFDGRLAGREAEINAVKNQLGRKNMESVTEINQNGFTGKIFIFGRQSDYLMELGKRVVFENVAVEGYVHSQGTSFNFIADAYDPEKTRNLNRLISQLRVTLPSEIPSAPGFCFGPGMLLDPLTAGQRESLTLFAALPGHPDVAIAFTTMAGMKPSPGLLERNARSTAREPFWMRAAFTTLREGRRLIHGLSGEELVMRVTELNFSTVFGLDWEMAGSEHDVLAPFVHLEMETGRNPHSGGKPVPSSFAETALLGLWDKIAGSVRLRPIAPVKTAEEKRAGTPLGAYAMAGDTCPESGWWRCNDGGSGVGVLGGQQQYLQKGQRMPQALLLPPASLWDKLRGVQPSYEANVPTAWKLADKRARRRIDPGVPLAQAAVSAGTAGVPASAAVAVGTYIRTGEPCTASGWWRCEEASALDGTRWFALGSLLPVATFKVPAGSFGKASARPAVIQRRSKWQFVRSAQEPAPPQQRAAEAPAVEDSSLLS